MPNTAPNHSATPSISFFGAAGEVTGSCYIVTQGKTRVMVDMGMHQGEKEADEHNRRLPDGDLSTLDAVVLTHAHLDHCGRLPLLIKAGYKGPIFCTPATAEVTGIILRDAAFLQKEDCDRYNRKLRPNQAPCEEPLYDDADVDLTLRLIRPLPYTTPKTIAPGFEIEFADAGHILGAASVRMTIASPDRPRTILFSGDVGVTGSPILRDPSLPPHNGIDAVILESTYGDRDHRPLDQTKAEFLEILKDVQAKRARVLIPAFAVGRTQDIVFHIGEFFRNGQLKRMPIIVDSPMASSVSTLYTKHKDVYDDRAKELLADGMKPLAYEGLSYTRSPDESKLLNDREGPLVIISASGMATGGRIMHHLVRGLPDPNTHVVIVGFQGHGTLGRRLVDRAETVRIYGMEINVNAKVHTLGGFSAHAGQTGLLNWAKPVASATHKPHFYLTHGEDHPRSVLASLLRERFNVKVDLPYYADTVTLH